MKKIIALWALLITITASAQIPQPQKNTYVNDFAQVLSKSQITELNKKIFKLEKASKVQLAVVLVNKIPSVYDIQDFAVLIGKKWHVGKNKRGIVYVAAIKQRKQRLEVAANLEDDLPGVKCLAILDAIKPSFKAADYNAGIETLVAKIGDELSSTSPVSASQPTQGAIDNTANTNTTASTGIPKKDDNETLDQIIGGLVICVPILLIVLYIRNQRRKRMVYRNAMNMNDPNYFNPGSGAPGYNDPYNYGGQQRRTNWGGILGGAAAGAAAGYAARTIQDRLSENHRHQQDMPSNSFDMPDNGFSTERNEPSSWGNWGDSGSSGSSDSSSYDSGFSDSSSSDSGASSDW